MPTQTPMKCFRIKDDAIYTQDMAGHRKLICVAANADTRDFIMYSLTNFHTNTPTLTWDNPARAVAPFTEAQIKALTEYQRSIAHPYTCSEGHGFLVPTREGLTCPWADCRYTQTWAHAEHTGM